MSRPSCTLICPCCSSGFSRPASIVAAMQRRNPDVILSCGKPCSDQLKQRALSVLDRRSFEYTVGVVLGDGNVGRAVRVAVGLQDEPFIPVLRQVFLQGVGVDPGVQRNDVARSFSVNLSFKAAGDLYRQFKRGALWDLAAVLHPEMVLAGLCDTDGGWEHKKGRRVAFCITQKDNGNLEKSLPLWAQIGIKPTIRYYAPNRAVLRVPAGQREHFCQAVPLQHPRKVA